MSELLQASIPVTPEVAEMFRDAEQARWAGRFIGELLRDPLVPLLAELHAEERAAGLTTKTSTPSSKPIMPSVVLDASMLVGALLTPRSVPEPALLLSRAQGLICLSDLVEQEMVRASPGRSSRNARFTVVPQSSSIWSSAMPFGLSRLF